VKIAGSQGPDFSAVEEEIGKMYKRKEILGVRCQTNPYKFIL
jgi:hypothetical protein